MALVSFTTVNKNRLQGFLGESQELRQCAFTVNPSGTYDEKLSMYVSYLSPNSLAAWKKHM